MAIKNSKNSNREYITAISIASGIITLISPDGEICYYRQRGIGAIPDNYKKILIANGMLNPNWNSVKELPKNWTIEFEDEEIMGKARASFPLPREMKK